jgi:hypothetical protein
MKDLPNRIIPIPCSDKVKWQESWDKPPGRNLLNIPHSWRGIFIGPPSSGKSTLIKNIILRAKPRFREVLVYHFDPDNSTEWDDVDAKMLTEFPDPKGFDGSKKRLLVFEDCNLKSMSNEHRAKLNRLLGYTSSHCNLSVAITAQNPYDIDPPIRRMANLIVLWKNHDLNSLKTLASRTGLKASHIEFIMLYLLKQPHSSLMIDLQRDSPAPYRIDGYTPITLAQLDDGVKLLKKG